MSSKPAKKDESAVSVSRNFTDDDLRNITSFDDAMAAVAELHGDIQDISGVLGNGFTVLQDKKQLCGKPFLLIETRFNPNGDFGAFVTLAVMTKQNERFMVNDGSTGIATQLEGLKNNGERTAGLLVYGGLRESTYDTCDTCGMARPATDTTCTRCGDDTEKRSMGTTYYLDLTQAP